MAPISLLQLCGKLLASNVKQLVFGLKSPTYGGKMLARFSICTFCFLSARRFPGAIALGVGSPKLQVCVGFLPSVVDMSRCSSVVGWLED